MPRYEYDCSRCGSFSDFRPLAEYDLPVACPNCGTEAPRAVLCFPAMSTRPATDRRAEATRFATASSHGTGCRCCGGNLKIPRKEWMGKLL
jgi:putative FmdB family regulatory protein